MLVPIEINGWMGDWAGEWMKGRVYKWGHDQWMESVFGWMKFRWKFEKNIVASNHLRNSCFLFLFIYFFFFKENESFKKAWKWSEKTDNDKAKGGWRGGKFLVVLISHHLRDIYLLLVLFLILVLNFFCFWSDRKV